MIKDLNGHISKENLKKDGSAALHANNVQKDIQHHWPLVRETSNPQGDTT